ncbi:hypothetical protein CEUSTIGMA_g3389.t1 [Chlamydomonas eustigma]|uniref:amino-acid N-acetyltransferase n=1 Tax=Chlamydomonas eustigma TaxID=1157962 RepID=A0A250WYT6_9CHLO|nr:hypothetical protein CEUSTIGMA_g3389.t1 [Chlamydomonas eustigma]|eukprot:GAX75946.1 hypothetical protein CEUSTIGMA_g3389.t1 [Chlamydomonas eustigma]
MHLPRSILSKSKPAFASNLNQGPPLSSARVISRNTQTQLRDHIVVRGSYSNDENGHESVSNYFSHIVSSSIATGDAASESAALNTPLPKSDFGKFVHFFRQASPYISGHRDRTFVIVIPGNVSSDRALLHSALSDVALLHGLGVNLVVVAGVQNQIDHLLRERKMVPRYMAGYRITDRETMKVIIEAAGEVRTQCEQSLSKGPFIPMIRRHTKGEKEIHFEPALTVVSGNYIASKRRGIVNGTDYGLTGEVRFVMKDAIRKQLDLGNIVLLNNLGFTAGGEVLNCSTHDVGLAAAVGLNADKLFTLHLDDVVRLGLPAWLPVSDAQKMLLERVEGLLTGDQMDVLRSSLDVVQASGPASFIPTDSPDTAPSVSASVLSLPKDQIMANVDIWRASGFPMAVSSCVLACTRGVKRAHLVDARLDGGLILELYSRDGVGIMISGDFYEGIRKAVLSDVDDVQALLLPLEKEGVLVKRSRHELEAMMKDFIVIERENKVLGCAMLLPLGQTDDGVSVAEVGAFCVNPVFRGSGRGDSMLDYVEQEARRMGIRRLVLLTTRTADWFEQREFLFQGKAFTSKLLPEARRLKINPARNSQLYVKELATFDQSLAQPGKRIGF